MEDVKVVKSEAFALQIVKLYKHLTTNEHEFIISKQILRSGTSIGANIAESICAESKDDFIHKLSIAQKEASETRYWLKLLYMSEYITESQFKSINLECLDLLNIISSIIAKLKKSRR